MTLLVRTVEGGKWRQKDIMNVGMSIGDVSADAITSLRTQDNVLSTWKTGVGDKMDAVLAIASGFERPETIDVAFLNEQRVIESGLSLRETEGLTPLKGFIKNHRDILDLTYSSLGVVASLIVECIRRGDCERFTVADIKHMVKEAVDSGKISKDDLKDGMKKKIWKED